MSCLALSSRRVHVTQPFFILSFLPNVKQLELYVLWSKDSIQLIVRRLLHFIVRGLGAKLSLSLSQGIQQVELIAIEPSMFTNLSQKFTKFHQRTTEDQKLIVEFHSTFFSWSGYAPLCRPSLPVFRFFCVQDFHLPVTLHFLCHDDQAYHGLQNVSAARAHLLHLVLAKAVERHLPSCASFA